MAKAKNYMVQNIGIVIGMQILYLVVSFGIRTIFIQILGKEILGLDRLFTNIITLISFAELGIGEAIIFQIYSPLVKKNNQKVRDFLLFYRKIYQYIGSIIMLLGMLFLPVVWNFSLLGSANNGEVSLIYLLYVVNAGVSYFFVYRKALFFVTQKEYINVMFKQGGFCIQSLLQGIYLFQTYDLIGYLVIQLFCMLVFNWIQSYYAYKSYPEFLKGKPEKLSKEEIRSIKKNMQGIVLYMAGGYLITGTESIFITAFIGLSTAGVYANYTLIINAVVSILARAMRGLIGSIGQITARENKDEAFELFKKIYKTTILVYFLISLGLIVLLNPFIKIWLGSNYLLEQQVVLIIALQFFVTGLQYPSYLFRTALGLYQKGKWSPIILMTVYLLGSFLLIPKFGVVGSALSIAIGRLMSTTWVDPFLVFKSYFNKSCFRFIIRQYAIISCFIILEIFLYFLFY
ncbi:lipopolysaccharide biosynthesis protein [Listeria fleischmannii]|uniref:lipopolysaccharide biosynthesis protein n=1 Tax=Listeria fleischmannii TaxID=1069827 RepID=UPI001629FD21|nr:hypothetical protein [Listeria fleischmannii]MBC1419119.1 hypothetical protein [Listeria fleischmannii]